MVGRTTVVFRVWIVILVLVLVVINVPFSLSLLLSSAPENRLMLSARVSRRRASSTRTFRNVFKKRPKSSEKSLKARERRGAKALRVRRISVGRRKAPASACRRSRSHLFQDL